MLEGVSAGRHENGLEGAAPVTDRSTDEKSAMKLVFATLISGVGEMEQGVDLVAGASAAQVAMPGLGVDPLLDEKR